jgi:beta-lactam-binding protein with PASTA domain
MRVRRHLAPPMFRTIRGRRGLKQAGLVVAAFLAGYIITVFWLFPAPLFTSDHAVPRVLEEDGAAAKQRLDQQGFRARVEGEEPHPTAHRGTVIWQDPAPGTVLPAGRTVLLTTSAGPAPVAMPDVVGLDESQARKVIEAAGLQAGTGDSVPAGSDPGVVVATRPPLGVGRDQIGRAHV